MKADSASGFVSFCCLHSAVCGFFYRTIVPMTLSLRLKPVSRGSSLIDKRRRRKRLKKGQVTFFEWPSTFGAFPHGSLAALDLANGRLTLDRQCRLKSTLRITLTARRDRPCCRNCPRKTGIRSVAEKPGAVSENRAALKRAVLLSSRG